MIALAPWQALLDALGWVVAQIYDFIPNYGVTIILLTVTIRPDPAPARDQAGPLDAAHADRAAEDQADPGEVQGEQAASTGRDHEALQGVWGQPLLRVLAGAAAVPDPDRDVLGAAVAAASDPRPHRQRPVRGRVAADPRDAAPRRSQRRGDHHAGADRGARPPGADLGHLLPGHEPALLGRPRRQPRCHARRQESDGAGPRRTPSTAGATSSTGSPTTCSRC